MTPPHESSTPGRLLHVLLRTLHWVGSRERATIFGLLIASLSLWGFAELADEVMEGESHAFDSWVVESLRSADDLSDPLGPEWFEEIVRDMTALGGLGVLTLIAFAVVGYLLLAGHRGLAAYVAVAVTGGILLSLALKGVFDRDRPDLVPHETVVYTSSFPSGHSMMSAVVFLTLGVLLARIQSQHRLRAYILGVATLVTVLVGASRTYLGVHWPTDVLAGWSAGAAWATCCWMVMNVLLRRGGLRD